MLITHLLASLSSFVTSTPTTWSVILHVSLKFFSREKTSSLHASLCFKFPVTSSLWCLVCEITSPLWTEVTGGLISFVPSAAATPIVWLWESFCARGRTSNRRAASLSAALCATCGASHRYRVALFFQGVCVYRVTAAALSRREIQKSRRHEYGVEPEVTWCQRDISRVFDPYQSIFVSVCLFNKKIKTPLISLNESH